MLKLISSVVALAGLAGCAAHDRVEVVLDQPNPRELLAFYFGSYTAGGQDPFAAGILSESRNRYFAYPEKLDGLGAALRTRTSGGKLTWDSLGSFLEATYYEARRVPQSLSAFKTLWPYQTWPSYVVDGAMTRAQRRIFVSDTSIRQALEAYHANGQRLIYPDSTAIVAEHYLENNLIEYTAMVRRADHFWDYVTYGADGTLSATTQALPRAMATPLQCVGCHFGDKLFEPERSFPQMAPPAPDGPRAYYVEGPARDAQVVDFFAEHARRSDRVLGLYASIFVARMRAQRALLSDQDHALLHSLGL